MELLSLLPALLDRLADHKNVLTEPSTGMKAFCRGFRLTGAISRLVAAFIINELLLLSAILKYIFINVKKSSETKLLCDILPG